MVTSRLLQLGNYYYYFDYEGCAKTNDFMQYGGVAYQFDASGNGTKMADGWAQKADGDWYYIKDGAYAHGWVYSGGAYYYCDNGLMLDSAYVWDENGSYYVLGADGAMITTPGWYTVDQNSSYPNSYYVYVQDSYGRLADGWLQVGGTWYYMAPTMYSGEAALDPVDETTYNVWWADNTGACTQVTGTGYYTWYDGEDIYVENGVFTIDSWRLIDGEWYYYDAYGRKTHSGVYEINGKDYLFAEDGHMCDDGWAYINNEWFYANTDGTAATGLTTIGGKQYLFSEWGALAANMMYEEDGTWYCTDVDGVVITSGTKDGWYTNGSAWYYVLDGRMANNTTLVIDGKVYGFDYSGKMYANVIVNDYGVVYYFDASGAAKTGWIEVNGVWYYGDLETAELYSGGEYRIGGKTYFFDRDGVMQTGTLLYGGRIATFGADGAKVSETELPDGYFYAEGFKYLMKDGKPYSGWLQAEGNWYYFDGGYMLSNREFEIDDEYYYFDVYGVCAMNEWINVGYNSFDYNYETWALAKADGSLYNNEWYTPDGSTWYYFESLTMAQDGIYYIDGVPHEFDENGVWLGEYGVAKITGYADGWHYINNEWYYFHAGNPVTGFKSIDGKWYMFEEDGVMCADGFYGNFGQFFYFDASGARVDYSGWVYLMGDWAYFDENHAVVTGWLNDGGVRYYLDYYYDYDRNGNFIGRFPYMAANEYVAIDGQLYYFDGTGACTGAIEVGTGWYNAGGEWVYFENGTLAEGYRVIDGKGYVFYDGYMQTDCIDETYAGVGYFGADGAQVTAQGWHLVRGQWWIYIGANGNLYDSVWEIDGVVNYFDNYMWVAP